MTTTERKNAIVARLNAEQNAINIFTEITPAQVDAIAAAEENTIDATVNALRDATRRNTRSAWDRGVRSYELELLDNLRDVAIAADLTTDHIMSAMLNGARNWDEYSWGGCSAIYDEHIARRLCTPSELRRTYNGHRRPNANEAWLDVQARALFQAASNIRRAAAELDARKAAEKATRKSA